MANAWKRDKPTKFYQLKTISSQFLRTCRGFMVGFISIGLGIWSLFSMPPSDQSGNITFHKVCYYCTSIVFLGMNFELFLWLLLLFLQIPILHSSWKEPPPSPALLTLKFVHSLSLSLSLSLSISLCVISNMGFSSFCLFVIGILQRKKKALKDGCSSLCCETHEAAWSK